MLYTIVQHIAIGSGHTSIVLDLLCVKSNRVKNACVSHEDDREHTRAGRSASKEVIQKLFKVVFVYTELSLFLGVSFSDTSRRSRRWKCNARQVLVSVCTCFKSQ